MKNPIRTIIIVTVILFILVFVAFCTGCTLPGRGGQVEFLRKGDPAPFDGYLWSGILSEK